MTSSWIRTELLEQKILLTAGDLDPSFGVGGQVETEFDNTATWGRTAMASARQADGKIVAAGEGAIARYLPDGSLDVTFGVAGRVAFPYYARSLAIQTDGKIVVAGGTDELSSQDFAVARYLSNGTLDNSFDGDGRRLIGISGVASRPTGGESLSLQTDGRMISMANGNVYRFNTDGSPDTTFDLDSVASFGGGAKTSFIQPDGKIVGGGTKNGYFGLVRFNSDGSPDTGFSADGIVTTVFGSTYDEAGGSALQSDGRIVVVGTSALGFGISRYRANGSLDTDFSQDGKEVMDFGPVATDAKAYDVAIQPDGKIVVAGTVRTVIHQTGFTNFAVVRLNPDGSPDLSFSGDGTVTTLIGGSGIARTIAIQSDGRIVVAGDGQGGFFAVVRYNTDGSLDTTFSGDGIATTISQNSSSSSISDIALLPDGKILAVGNFYPAVTGLYDSALMMVRYNANGSLDTTFGTNGRVVDWGSVQRTGNDVELLADGSFLVAGDATLRRNGSFYSKMAVTRYNSNGSVYGPFGTVVQSFSVRSSSNQFTPFEATSSATSLLVQPNGKVVLGGTSLSNVALIRLNSDGTLDTSFDGDGKLLTPFGTDQSGVADLLQQPNGRLIAVGSRRTPYRGSYDSDFVLARYLNRAEPEASMLVTINANGYVEVSDLWSRDDFMDIRRVGETLIITDTTTDSHAKFRVTGAPGVLGDGTKQITIPLSLVQLTGMPLIVNGLAGDDTLTVVGDAELVPLTGFVFQGGAGLDKLSQESSTLTSTWNVSSSGNGSVTPAGRSLRRFTSVEFFVGGEAEDVFRLSITASSSPLVVDAGGADNRLELSADADIELSYKSLLAAESEVNITGTINQQVLLRGFTDATLTGGAGNNRLDASRFLGRVRLFGRDGNDVLLGTQKNDILDGGGGDDILLADYGDDILRGGNGNDSLNGESGNDVLYGDAGNDIVIGGIGADVLFGGSGEDILIGYGKTSKSMPSKYASARRSRRRSDEVSAPEPS